MKIEGIQDHPFESSKDKREQRSKERKKSNQDWALKAPSCIGDGLGDGDPMNKLT